tara:strand:+ start:672 stop:1079 length:408 start_codon:yes stop_codon:yes gene_type:complete
MQLKKNTLVGKANLIFLLFILVQLLSFRAYSDIKLVNEKFADINILDKVSSKTFNLKLEIGKELEFQNLVIKILKCNNSKFDDDPEVTAYMQVRELNEISKNKVFIFNGWTFASSPSIKPFDHPVYDIWLKKCYS